MNSVGVSSARQETSIYGVQVWRLVPAIGLVMMCLRLIITKRIKLDLLNSYTKSALCNGRGHSWQGLEGIAFTGKVLKDHGKCMAQVSLGFDTIMENHDGSGAGMLDDILGAIFRGDVTVEIAAEDIPHDDAVVPLEKLDLAWF